MDERFFRILLIVQIPRRFQMRGGRFVIQRQRGARIGQRERVLMQIAQRFGARHQAVGLAADSAQSRVFLRKFAQLFFAHVQVSFAREDGTDLQFRRVIVRFSVDQRLAV